MTYLSLSLFLAALWWFAFREASNDADTIAKDRAVYHIPSWFRRAALMMSLMVTSTCFIDLDLTSLLGFLLMSAGGFSALFRAKLNILRGKGWWYMGLYLDDRTKKDAWYDGLFHRFARFIARSPASAYYPRCLPATLAYIVESIAFAGGLYLVIKP